MTPTILPQWQITQGISYVWEALVLDDHPASDAPITDWELHTAIVEISESISGPVLWTGTATCTAEGYTTVTLSEAETLEITTKRSIGGTIAATAEITITDPSGSVLMIWQAPVRIYRSIKA